VHPGLILGGAGHNAVLEFLVKPTLCCYVYNREKITPARGFLSAEHSGINWSNWLKPGPVQLFKINRLHIICFKIRQSFFSL